MHCFEGAIQNECGELPPFDKYGEARTADRLEVEDVEGVLGIRNQIV
jgi:hypothetical protein